MNPQKRFLKMEAVLFLLFFFVINSSAQNQISILENSNNEIVIRFIGNDIFTFNGIPTDEESWGEDLVYEVTSANADSRTIGALGGIPLVDFWNEFGGIAIFNTTTYQEPFKVDIEIIANGIEVTATGGTNLQLYMHNEDYYTAIKEFALQMDKKGMAIQEAPKWAFDANWETYGYEEDFDVNTVLEAIPLLHELGIKTVTFDSGWYGEGTGEDYEFYTGDYEVNPDIIGSEQDFIDLIETLHQEGFKVRLLWVPGVAEDQTELNDEHPDWFTELVISATGDTNDEYLDPQEDNVIAWNKETIERFISYGIDGFKQDDIYHYISDDISDHIAYQDLINSILPIAQAKKSDFAVNTCNCGLAQNFYQICGQNQLITSDPVGSKQFRIRGKYLKALNINNNAAILGDHIELTQGDVGPDDLDAPGFYNDCDFSSVVPLGLVLQTKFRKDPGPKYRKWFAIYHKYKFYDMEWIPIPYVKSELETYLLRENSNLYFSFFTENTGETYSGDIELTHLTSGKTYDVIDYVNDNVIANFIATSSKHTINTDFSHSLSIHVKETTSTGIDKLYEPNIEVYPNPTTGIFTISAENIETIKVTDIHGQLIDNKRITQKKNVQHSSFSVDLTIYPKGMYFVILTDKRSKNEHTVKIIKE